MQPEYYKNLETYEDLDAHKSAVLNNIDAKDKKIIEKAIKLVEKYHNTSRTLYPGNYNRHPLRVARILLEEFGIKNTNAILIALCHDLGEWTNYNIEDLEKEFNAQVKNAVTILTWNKNDSWDNFFQKIITTDNKNIINVKMADKLDNNRAAAFSNSAEEKRKAINKTELILKPFIEKEYPLYWSIFEKSLQPLI